MTDVKASNKKEVSDGRNDGPEINPEEGHIQSNNSGGPEPPRIGESAPIDSEQMLPGATTTIAEVVEICGALTLYSDDIGAIVASKSVKGDGSAEATQFGIKEITLL
ncbi:hypothetical protein DEO72_LG3g1723 [Vigna unguiculata]|uniref:Uncharacterized protein n=1 Tax=Vigna unguiculata TaxID=3917 RepID=A0A4D6LEY9_VIGUN|nr:hypothetical protein DEO72_LG3g1723 [Vigna unguiculata]